ncbi:ABC transporter ATP-binding protein [Carnobacterium maltaromaticum]|uniref:ABC transporter ATP-binding protein n=1 Tax=Carnobacterium maltaromaticum TaxID=2751 RepID=UPI000704CCC0|nr:ABC transporter ATP-binding protein [Carnobacterium maltaromaticum]MBC9809667.1 ATP-binding cassette domain-containing protein [Carnobacterium maltaromaticum]MDT1946375.1 ABC transporter ATP-binding protein/permease [Carnobacterium maltaromaticum]MDT2000743.1 ABC transporter ATP-binding protein/permease [Carnobacterium maltaromaticum]TFJ30800.1 ABC transporter ATP-binding protein [Carnobacterium maltaromaticum]TFJ33991.1 ABC transporter ATP-binding protein [Carnobacterium maltaromaticum]
MISLLRYAKKYRLQMVIGPFFKFVEAVFELFLPLLMAKLIDNGINKGDTAYIYKMGGLMLAMSVIGLISVFICQYSASIASQGFGTELRNALMRKINTFSHKEIDQFGTATLITRATNDINQMQLALAMLIRLVIRAPFLSIGSLIMAIYVSPKLALVFAVLLPLFCLILYFIMTKTIPLYKIVQMKVDRLTQVVSENLSGVRVIRAFARSKKEKQRAEDVSDELAKSYIRVANLSALMTPATSLIMNAGILIILYVGGFQVNTGSLMQGEVLALINYIMQMLLALIIVANLVVIFTKSAASAARINEVLDTDVSVVENESPTYLTAIENQTAIQFENVSFKYAAASANALENIEFNLSKGQILGVTGPTGSGKSTLINLIPRFYDVTAGTLLINGTNVNEFDLQSLRRSIGYVPQNSSLFTGTIAENLRWGKADATEAELQMALEIAQSADFVASLKDGLNSPVFEGGKNFSGGQRQRLTIARALVSQPDILILDDSLSALDYQTDLNLRRALASRLTNTTVVIVSQRISSIQTADQILVLNDGKLANSGTHKQLLAESDIYRQIYDSQSETETDVKEVH